MESSRQDLFNNKAEHMCILRKKQNNPVLFLHLKVVETPQKICFDLIVLCYEEVS